MKYLQLSTYYQRALDYIMGHEYERVNTCTDIENVIKNNFIESHRWPYFLNNQIFQVQNIFVNSFHFQKQWTIENGYNIKNMKNWHQEVVFLQIKKYKPDIIFITSEAFFDEFALKYIRENFKFIKKIIIWQGIFISNQKEARKFKYVDEVFTSSKDIKNSFQDQINCTQIHYAFDEGILKNINQKKKINQVLFLGSIYPERSLHGERANYINHLIKNINSLKIYSNVNNYNFINYSKNFIFKMFKISNYKDFDIVKDLVFYINMYNIGKVNTSGTFFGIDQFKKIGSRCNCF